MAAALLVKPPRSGQFSKTKLCRFELLGICAKGPECPFAHGQTELKALPDLRCTKLCRELLSTGQCTTLGCSYAHTKQELRSAASSKMDSSKRKAKRGSSGIEKEATQQRQVEPEAQVGLELPPGLDQFSQGQDVAEPPGAEELKLYTRALAAVLQTLPSNLGPAAELPNWLAKKQIDEKLPKRDVGLGSLPDPAYVPLRLGLDELQSHVDSGEGAGSTDSGGDLTEASTVAEEVAAAALEGFAHDDYDDYNAEGLGIFGSSYAGSFNVEAWDRQDCQSVFGAHSMEKTWDWNMWGADGGSWMGAGNFSSFGGLAAMMQDGTSHADLQGYWPRESKVVALTESDSRASWGDSKA